MPLSSLLLCLIPALYPPSLSSDKDQLLEIAKANAAAMCAKAGVPIPESLRPKAILQLPLPTPSPTPLSLPLPLPLPMGMGMSNMGQMGMSNIPGMSGMSNITMSAAMASMTAATMTAALTNMGALASMPPLAPLPTITNKPPPSLAPPTPTLNLDHIEEAKRKVTQQANIHTIKELTEVRGELSQCASLFERDYALTITMFDLNESVWRSAQRTCTVQGIVCKTVPIHRN